MEKLELYFNDIFNSKGYEDGKKYLLQVKNRYNIIAELAENEEEAKKLNENYENVYNKIEKIYKNDYKIKQEEAKKINDNLEKIVTFICYIIFGFYAIIYIAYMVTLGFINAIAKMFIPKKSRRKRKLF